MATDSIRCLAGQSVVAFVVRVLSLATTSIDVHFPGPVATFVAPSVSLGPRIRSKNWIIILSPSNCIN